MSFDGILKNGYHMGMLRINGGLYKGRVLKGGTDPSIRPTMTKVKLSLFDTLQEEIREAIFLDGFAGTGNVGIEALSRGAEYVVFVDPLAHSASLIRHNLEKIGVPADKYRVIRGEFNRSVIHLAKEGFRFDLVFLDPPYEMLAKADPLKVIFKRGILAGEGRIVLERSSRYPFSSPFFRLDYSRRFGKEILDYYRSAEEKTD